MKDRINDYLFVRLKCAQAAGDLKKEEMVEEIIYLVKLGRGVLNCKVLS